MIDWNLAGAVILSGMVLVFVALTLLIGIVEATGKIIRSMEQKKLAEQTLPPNNGK